MKNLNENKKITTMNKKNEENGERSLNKEKKWNVKMKQRKKE